MITLYELHWSHYCEKIRWALHYKQLPWRRVGINAFSKKQLQTYSCPHLVPLIHDEKTDVAVNESSKILDYLERAYPDSLKLFPTDEKGRSRVYKLMIELDSKLGIPARRLAYTQVIVEKPTILAELFFPNIFRGVLTWPLIRNVSSMVMGFILIKRFRFDLNEELKLYSSVERYLVDVLSELKDKKYLINDCFSAADITLATLLRPLRIIPFFRENPALTKLFTWQESLLSHHHGEKALLYEEAIEQIRCKRPPVRRLTPTLTTSLITTTVDEQVNNNIKNGWAYNDQQPIWTWRLVLTPYYYFFKIRRRMVRRWDWTATVR